MTTEEINNASRVEEIVCRFFCVDKQDLKGRDKKSALNLARHFTMFILHTRYGMSNATIAKQYNRCIRTIKYVTSNMNYFLKHDKDIINKYNKLMEYFD